MQYKTKVVVVLILLAAAVGSIIGLAGRNSGPSVSHYQPALSSECRPVSSGEPVVVVADESGIAAFMNNSALTITGGSVCYLPSREAAVELLHTEAHRYEQATGGTAVEHEPTKAHLGYIQFR